MKKTFLFPLFFLFAFPANSQVIRGRVLDQKTRESIDFALVFFNGTFHGTTTAEDGSFELNVTPYAGRTLQISAMGYNSSSLKSLIEGEFYEVLLERARKKTYMGSCRQFFTALWKNELSSEGFQVYEKESLQPVEYDEMVVSISDKKYFSCHNLEISYNHFLSTVSFRGPGSYFAEDGFFEPEGILWYGTMSFDRIADWLPYEYSPN